MGRKKPTRTRKHERFFQIAKETAERMKQEKTTSLAGTGGKVEWYGGLLPDFGGKLIAVPRVPEALKDMAELVNACEDEEERRGVRKMLQAILDRACVPGWVGYFIAPTEGGKIDEITWFPPQHPIAVHRFDADGAR